MAKKKSKKRGPATTPPKATQEPKPAPAAPAPAEPPTSGGGLPLGFAAGIWTALAVAAGAAIYLLYAYIGVTYSAGAFESACNFNETLNCDKLNTSSWGKIAGVPITVFAVPTYLAMAVLTFMATKGGSRGRTAIDLVVWAAMGAVAYGAFLLGVMILIEEVYCLFCMSMDLGAVAVLALAWIGRKKMTDQGVREFGPVLMPAVGAGVLGLVVAFGWFSMMRSSGEEEMKAVAAEQAKETEKAVKALKQTDGTALQATGKARLIAGNLYEVPVDANDASYGPEDAEVVVVEYADFACGYCKKLTYSLGQMKKRYEGKVRWVFKHFPMNPQCNSNIKNTRHKNACESAEAAECARQQDKFWPMHDLMFKNQHKLGLSDLPYYAQEAGLDVPAFKQCMAKRGGRSEVKKDIAEGNPGALELTGTPRTFVNGQLFKGVAAAAIEQAIDKALGGEGPPKIAPAPRAKLASPAEIDAMAGMTKITREAGTSFYIDTFEASVDSKGRALSLPRVLPANSNWYEAKEACEAAGKRLCTTEEWVTTCQSADAVDDDNTGSYADDYVEGNQFPYADWHERGWCHDMQDGRSGKPVATGSKPRCATESRVYDLGGNVAEWAGANEDLAVLLGGDFGSKDKAGCFRPNRTWGPGHKNLRMGFRCCANDDVPNAGSEAVAKVAREGLEGSPLPSFEGELMTGGTLGSDTMKGDVTYLTFFASWCTPCKREFPELTAMQKEYGAQGLKVVSVGVDTDPRKSAGFARKVGAEFPIILDSKGLIQGLFDVKSMPTSYIIDRKGVIRHKQVGFSPETTPGKVRPVIEKLLAESP
ncbi:MAG: thioredoxin domain-containing protein [Deltaproteobacteria bacterium]|nr:thioredoxin domain-containing protein [Deltaproteobacteria bacterium]